MSDLSEPNALIDSLPFLTHADLFIPAAEPPNDTVEVSLRARARAGAKPELPQLPLVDEPGQPDLQRL